MMLSNHCSGDYSYLISLPRGMSVRPLGVENVEGSWTVPLIRQERVGRLTSGRTCRRPIMRTSRVGLRIGYTRCWGIVMLS